jgi:phosphate transport system substrate-binding protein
VSVPRGASQLARTVGSLVLLLLAACSSKGPDPYTDDVPTKGHVVILADEDLRSLVEAEEYVFESIYPKAELEIRYLPESELLKEVLNDSVRCWIGTVQPGGEQEAYYAKRSIKAHVVPIATDGIALIGNKGAKYSDVSRQTLKWALSAERDKSWLPRYTSGSEDKVSVRGLLFAGQGNGVARMMVDSLFNGDASNFNGYTVRDIDSLVALVTNDPSILGAVPFSAISDLDNPRMKALRDQVQLLAVSASIGSPAFLPNQGTFADGSYPLRRPVYMILCEGKTGLGTGFVSFVAGHKGQRIILKQGLAPQHVPAREVEIVNE